jgi:hypothetical protein
MLFKASTLSWLLLYTMLNKEFNKTLQTLIALCISNNDYLNDKDMFNDIHYHTLNYVINEYMTKTNYQYSSYKIQINFLTDLKIIMEHAYTYFNNYNNDNFSKLNYSIFIIYDNTLKKNKLINELYLSYNEIEISNNITEQIDYLLYLIQNFCTTYNIIDTNNYGYTNIITNRK